MSVLQKLTEGIVNRDLAKEGAALLDKWEKTGLLEGLEDQQRQGMAVLLENQAKELLREASSMAAGDVEGFAAVAFPIVRRVFGGLVANKLVSVQPMSLPSGLIFFLDFTYANGSSAGGDGTTAGLRAGVSSDESVYGGGVVGQQLTGGVTDLTEDGGGFYNLQSGYSSPTGSTSLSLQGHNNHSLQGETLDISTATIVTSLTDAQKKAVRFDPDLLALTGNYVIEKAIDSRDLPSDLNLDNLIAVSGNWATGSDSYQIRRLTRKDSTGNLRLYFRSISSTLMGPGNVASASVTYPIVDTFANAGAVGAVQGDPFWGLEGAGNTTGKFDGSQRDVIPEIDISVDSVAVTAITKKLKAKWTPELAQDLNAYHNLDAEVELTSILSEQIALEIDQEILNDLVQRAAAGTYYWSRRPGRFVDRSTGSDISTYSNESLLGADFTGTVSEWYETLAETINDISAQIHRKTLRGGANFIVVGPEVANILEFTAGFRASVTGDADVGNVGAVKVGSLSKKWDIFVDPYFLRNVVLVGRKGNSFLESGYVYAPYVPLQVTPTIFGIEDFVPRKGVMTRYAKKMVRPDMYGLVVVKDLNG